MRPAAIKSACTVPGTEAGNHSLLPASENSQCALITRSRGPSCELEQADQARAVNSAPKNTFTIFIKNTFLIQLAENIPSPYSFSESRPFSRTCQMHQKQRFCIQFGTMPQGSLKNTPTTHLPVPYQRMVAHPLLHPLKPTVVVHLIGSLIYRNQDFHIGTGIAVETVPFVLEPPNRIGQEGSRRMRTVLYHQTALLHRRMPRKPGTYSINKPGPILLRIGARMHR